MCDNCGCGSMASMMDVSVTSAMNGMTNTSGLGSDNSDLEIQSAPKNTIGN